MPANLPPQFFKLQEELKKEKDIDAKIEILEEMLSICPKHKGTERIISELKRKLSKLKKERIKTKPKTKHFFVKKEGDAQVVICGPLNSGKSTIFNLLTNAQSKVAPYPFTTISPVFGMMKYQNLKIQIIDTPPISENFFPGWLKSILKSADLIIAVFDASDEKIKENLKIFNELMEKNNIDFEKIFYLANKTDIFELKSNHFFSFSANHPFNLENLKEKIFHCLKILRVYLKEPKKQPDFENPLVVKKGTKLLEILDKIKPGLKEKFKAARLYQKDLKKYQIVGKYYELKDEDILEFY